MWISLSKVNNKNFLNYILIIVFCLVCVSCSSEKEEQYYRIELTDEDRVQLEKIKAPAFDSIEDFYMNLEKLSIENQEYLIETIGEDNILHFSVNSNLGINEYLFEEDNIDELLELALEFSINLEEELDYEQWSKLMEVYCSNYIPSVESTEEEFINFINDYFSEIGYIPVFDKIEGDGNVITYNAFAWGDTASISFIKSENISEEFFAKSVLGDYYTIVVPIERSIFSIITNELVFVNKTGKYIMFFKNTGFMEDDLLIIDSFINLEN